MAKKTKTALKDLITALEKHQGVLEDKKSGHGKRDRATAKVRTAAIAYASAVYSRTGGASPFLDLPDPGLDESTVASLKAEKEALVAKQSQKKSSKHAAPEAPAAAAAPADSDGAPSDAAAQESTPAAS
ncbi:hypothetical protein ITJ64_08860 [Herbiconiux sp. VKM Ac-1786]|jgi:hypothetical protein|uniref:hypothetical protein n=1 Tax=Herbiconiux sp. VKM Ac-1786 TaxID=2783824 RepID=UPI00188B66EA|nr:hypothetical protein [Herbiconiux sp. VKM Ac-1786]MBF4572627.1 hypothetical protein [Herbiconiux sp. VKM Ac-1786]